MPDAVLHRLSLRAQVVLMLGSIAVTSALLTRYFVLTWLRIALEDAPAGAAGDALAMLPWIVGAVVASTTLVCLGAAVVLRSSLAHTLSRMQRATAEIAAGRFGHRIATTRDDELGTLATSIDAMAARLQELESARQRMIAAVSHELRTPLTVIRGEVFTLGRREEDEARAARFALVDEEIERLAAMIDDLLSAASLRAAPPVLDLAEVAVEDLVVSACERFAGRAAATDVEVACTIGEDVPRVRADRRRIEQVLANLVSNAVAHAPAGTCVELRVERVGDLDAVAAGRTGAWRRGRPKRACGHVRLSVTNGGEPIAPSRIDEIFEPFVQGERPTGSVGLGLAIARELVRAHGAEIAVASGEDGTTFAFELAAAAPAVATPAPAAMAEQPTVVAAPVAVPAAAGPRFAL